ncbi:MAG TPA: hypothetical protein VEW26_07940 [Allosphingosinicella sp.]|nr:hypothetical protein [Allosphingosinicella sp.]
MSDVLRRLASRALPGAAESVRPRLGSRFEPPPATSDSPEAGATGAAPRTVAPVAVAAATPATAGTDAPAAAAERSAPSPAAAGDPPEVRSTIAATADPGPGPAPAGAVAVAAPALERVTAYRPEPAFAEPAAAARAPVGVEAPAGQAAHSPPSLRESGRPRAESRIPELLLPEMRQAAEADLSGADPPPARREEPAPDVRISIGRIEVRAGSEPRMTAPRPQPRSRPSLMSLEEYLGKGRSRR